MNFVKIALPSLKKFQRIVRNRNPLILLFMILGSILVSGLVYYGLFRFLKYVGQAPMLGETLGPIIGGLLVSKLLEMIFMTLFFMVLFSSIISAFSSFFLNEELLVLMPTPQPIGRIFRSRFLLMTIESSWMVLIFFIPALYSFATAMKAPIEAYFIFPLFLLLFILMPNILGAFTALFLGSIFPIRQMKKVFQFLSIIVLTAMIFFLRSLEAEKLINPSYFKDVSQYILSLKGPLLEFSPSFWFHKATLSLFKSDILQAFKDFTPFVAFVILSFFLLNFLASKFYRRSWQLSMEALDNQVLGLEWLRKAIIFPFKFASPSFRVMATKEVTFFLRDPAFFSQIFMMTAIVFVYGYNLTILPLKDLPSLYSGEINDSLVYLNGPFIGFILAAIAMRFVFPSISMEGRAFWAVKASPISPRKILFYKYFLYLVPMLLLGISFCTVTNSVFAVSNSGLLYLSYLNVILITIVITALAIGVGTVYASFESDSPLKIAGSYGGFIYMLLSAMYVINLLILQAYPMFRFYFRKFYPFNFGFSGIFVVICGILLIICTSMWVYLPFKKGLEVIENYEPE